MNNLKQLIAIFFLCLGFYANGQDVDFNLRFNGSTNEYEVYARPTFTNAYYVGGGSQLSILLPSSVADSPMNIISWPNHTPTTPGNGAGGLWIDNSQVYSPAAAPGFDFHGIATSGEAVEFVNGEELLLFKFTLAEGCVPGVRLYENATDPNSTAPGMNGGDFAMFFTDVLVTPPTFINDWNSNYFNTGLVCPDAPVVLSNPITIPEGGTDSQCLPILDLNPTDTFTATLCTGSPANGTSAISISNNELCMDYTAAAGFTGTDEVCIIVCDNSSLCDTVSIPVTVLPALQDCPTPTPPVVVVTPITTAEDVQVTVCTNILDTNNNDTFTTSFCAAASNGTATATITASVLCIDYTPNAGYTGNDDLCIEVCDQNNNCDIVNVPVSVIATPVSATIDQNPVLVMPPLVTDEDITHTVCGSIIDANVTDTHFASICGQGTKGVATVVVDNTNNSLCLTYDPDPNVSGRDSVCITVCDQASLCYSLMVPIEIQTLNDIPLAIFDINTTQINTPVIGSVITNDSDFEGDNLTVNMVPVTVTDGTVVIDATGFYTFTPAQDFVGDATFQYEICDDGCPVGCDVATVIISVFDNSNPDNNSVVGIDDNFTMETGTTLTASVISNDYDPDGDNIIITTTPNSNPTNGTVVINPDGTIDYTPNPGFIGTEQFTYEICDDASTPACDIVTVTIDVIENNNTNDLYAVDDTNVGEVDQTQSGNVTLNDFDPEGDNLTVAVTPIFSPLNGTLTLNPDGTYTYVPNSGFIGNDFFIYEVCDDGNPQACDQASVYLTVLDSKDAPVVITNPLTVDINETGNLCMPIFDPNTNDVFTFTSCTGAAANGTTTTSIVAGNLCIEYTPNPGYSGYDEVCVTVCDQTGRCDIAKIPVTIVPDALAETNPDIPDAIITPITVVEGFTTIVCSSILDGNPNETFTITSCNGTPTNGALNITQNQNEYCLEYTPNSGFTGTDDLCLTICDVAGNCDQITVPVTVVPTPEEEEIAQTPILIMPPVVTYEDINVTTCGTVIDINPTDTHTVTICGAPINGAATATIDNTNNSLCIDFNPVPNFIGSDEVCVTVCDQGGLCYDLTVPIEVIPVNDPPIAIDDINNTQVNIPVDGNTLTNDSDPEGDNLTVSTTPINPTNGTVIIDALGNYTFTPDPGFFGNATFEYEVCDDGNPIECAIATVTILVIDITNPNNNSVLGVPDNYTTEDDAPLTSDLLANDTDPDGDNLTINTTPVTVPTNGTLTINPDGTFVYVPTLGIYGVETFSYEVCDDGTPQACAVVPVTITILEGNNVNDMYATDDFYIGDEDATITGNVVLNDNDPENGILTVSTTPIVAPTNGALTLNTDGTFTYIPTTDFTGNDQFVYEVCDDGTPTACATATAYFTILNVSTELKLKVMLQGALFGTTDGLMRTDLVDQNLVPLNTPYEPALESQSGTTRFVQVNGGNEVTTNAVLTANTGTADAIVDWVFVELRDASGSTTIQTFSALVQRDGDIVNAIDGGTIYIDSLPANFFPIVKHRNHLGAMSATPITAIAKVASFDFTTATGNDLFHLDPNYNGLEQASHLGLEALWAGNCNLDNKVKYDGPANDQSPLSNNIITYPGNVSFTLNFNNAIGYLQGDVNMDGKAKFDGFGNDRILIQSSVLTFPLNTTPLNNYDLLIEQIQN